MSNPLIYDEKNLLQRIADGDEDAFEQLFHTYFPRLYPVILHIVNTESVVKDIIQDVFLKLWIARDKLPAIVEPENYIFRIGYNQSFNYLKKQFVEDRVSREVALIYNDKDKADCLIDQLDLLETKRLIETAIQELPAQSRTIYRLNRIYGNKPQQIADQLGISVQSVRNSLSRSGKAIKEQLARHGIVVPLVILLFHRFPS